MSLSFIYIPQLVNEEDPAQSPQEGSAQEAPPPYSSIAAANAGNCVSAAPTQPVRLDKSEQTLVLS